MTFTTTRRKILAAAIALTTAAPSRAAAQFRFFAKPCEGERGVEGWVVKSALMQERRGGLFISRWETRKDFATDFGIRIILDTRKRPGPFLEIWHNYRRGEFTMRLPNGQFFTVPLSANYSITEGNLPPVFLDQLRTMPLRIEHTTAGGKWTKYKTDGLPSAIAAAEEDLAALKADEESGACQAKAPR